MIEVTEAAQAQVAEYFTGKEIVPVRVFLNSGGWGGPSFAMALDETKENDEVFELEGYKYVMDKDLLSKAAPVKIDFTPTGFKIDTGMDLGASACGSCSTSGSCCS